MQDYENYVYMQTVKYASHEDEHSSWAHGQVLFLNNILNMLPPKAKVLDVGCGDGISLEILNNLGFNTFGIDFNNDKLEVARSKGCAVRECDMHDISIFHDAEFDVVISSHSLEHAYDPKKVLSEFSRILRDDGLLFLVLPFPDIADYATEAHVGRDILGTSDVSNGKSKLVSLLNEHGFVISEIKEDSYREPEIWLFCSKTNINDY